jgi:putative SOS response-associated peptidase YedK
VAPGQDIIIVVKEEGKNKLASCRWGFVPSWSKDMSAGYKMINARAETVAEKPSFRDAFLKQRCLVVADGFYEWRKDGTIKRPMYIHLKSGEPLGFAGLYNTWTSPEGKSIRTCTIITTDANEILKPIHDRMPVIIPGSDYRLWLDPSVHDKEILLPILKPYPSSEMEGYPATPKVNSVKFNDPENIRPVSP